MLPSHSACFSFSVCLVALGAHACEPLVTKKKIQAALVGRLDTVLPEGQPAVNLGVQLDVLYQCS